ncbi:MAG: hypothetical protein LHW57_03770 [Candidatus Cloacimonetes bacterium]|nr:hypothetical protein [Candidatus Cloacimonadota bacterium]
MTKLLLPLLLLISVPLLAGNSAFAFDGNPLRYYGNDIYSLGMGDTGASDVFRINSGYGNPALHNLNNRSLFSTGLMPGYNHYSSKDSIGTKYSFLDNSLDFPYFSLSIPLKQHRLGFQFSAHSSGLVNNQREFAIVELPDTLQVTEKHSMDRYIYRADLIYSFAWGQNSVGVSGNYYFGHEIRNFKQDAGFEAFNTEEEIVRDYKNPGFTLGYIRHQEKFAIGAYYSLGVTMKGEEIRSSIHETEDPLPCEHKIPPVYSASVTALPYPEFKLAADFHYEPWQAIDPANYTDSWKAALGLAFEPALREDRTGILSLPLRTGVSWRQLPFYANGNEIGELALSLGLSLPLKGDVNRIDLGFQYSRRGNLDQNKLLDNSYLLMFGFTGFDILSKAPDRTAPREIPEKEDLQTW